MSVLIDAGLARELLRRHVLRRARRRVTLVGAGRGDAEVGDANVAVAVDHHVRRLEIAVKDAALVGRGDARAQLTRKLESLVLRNASDAAEQRAEILAVHVLHRQEAAAIGVAEVVQADDVLVGHLARHTQLVVKLREPAVVAGYPGRQEFQRDRLVERQVVGAIHFSHAAASEQGDKAVAAGDNRAWREGGRCLWPAGAAAGGGGPRFVGRSDRHIVRAGGHAADLTGGLRV